MTGSDKDHLKKIEKRSGEIGAKTLPTRPGKEINMETDPLFDDDFPGAGRLKCKVALITGGDSGIERAVAVAFAKEGAKIVITYLSEDRDAQDTKSRIERLGGEAIIEGGDVGDAKFFQALVEKAMERFGALDILVNNAAEQHPQDSILDIDSAQLEKTFRTNIFGLFHMVQAALPHLKEGASIINTSSVTAYEGNENLIDYAATKGAITTFTRSLAVSLADRKIRVNSVAPGPIWTPLIPSTFDPKKVESFGKDTLMKRPGQPLELAESYIFLAWERASGYITGQAIHVNGGRFVTS